MAELISGLFTASRYKRTQGRIARQVTLGALLAAVAAGAARLSGAFANDDVTWRYIVPLAVFGLGSWICFRIVNIPKFADFLISVEAEMNKVSWPSREELFRASVVVIVVIFFLAGLLFGYDLLLKAFVGGVLGL
ncbi:MAG: preprotein translocase subunit SecE [Planctomycetota bacterium]